MGTAAGLFRRILSVARSRRLRDDRGSELLEFAAASVVFFTVVFGTIEFGLAVWQHNMMSDLAQEGARWAAVHGKGSPDQKNATELQAYVQSRAPGFTVTVTSRRGAALGGCTVAGGPSDVGPGETICVQVDSSFSPVTALIPAATLTLTGTASMKVFR